jgi:hypothetical protein
MMVEKSSGLRKAGVLKLLKEMVAGSVEFADYLVASHRPLLDLLC